MRFQDLTPAEKINVKKTIKEDLQTNPRFGDQPNPNQFDYSRKNGLQIHGRLKNMDDNQIKSLVIRNVKSKLKSK